MMWCVMPVAIRPGSNGVDERHAVMVAPRAAALPRHRARQVLGQVIHHAFTPHSRGQLGADVLTDAPDQADKLGTDCLVGPLTGLLDQADDLGERGLDLAGASCRGYH